jgi:starch phosphorylase
MKNIQTFQVFPSIPKPLTFLQALSRNIWWSWHQNAIELFRRIDPRLWDNSGQNPIALAAHIPQKRFEELATDDAFLAHMEEVQNDFKKRVLSPIDRSASPYGEKGTIAYFSMEFGIHESMPLFAGGLGILAGDHLKASSTLALPLVGVGLLYREGYFRQFLTQDGWQQEEYPETDLYNLPLSRKKDQHGNDLIISVPGPESPILAKVWQIRVGRIPLYLLDTNLPENPPEIRDLTARLYAGEPNVRLAQEVLLGIGGLKALAEMGITPTVCHMNEGHCAFVAIERLARIIKDQGLALHTALEIIPRTTVFTTHTPVAAGHDEFPVEMVHPYLEPYAELFNIPVEQILSWGQPEGSGSEGPFSMFVLGLRHAQYCNGVSKLHGKVARKMWDHVWPNRTGDDVPINHVTNGIHISTFISPEMALLLNRYQGPDWYLGYRRAENIKRIDHIYDEEFWRAHEMSRAALIRLVRERLTRQYSRRNAPSTVMRFLETILDPNTLTIGFARRFATYKRAHMIFRDVERLAAILNNQDRPVQIIFAGKAHPRDNEGKELIKNLLSYLRRPELRPHIVFIEDYDLHIGRKMVQGVDVWLNTPRRPLEACGTSGMKAAANGVLNFSVLDGWWCEGYSPERGWRIGNGEEYDDHEYQDTIESQALYNILENDIVPCFYDRPGGGIPATWIKKMKASMKMAMQHYCSTRMVEEYHERFYMPANQRYWELIADGASPANDLSRQHQRLQDHWSAIRIDPPQRSSDGPFRVDEAFEVSALVHLGELLPEEVRVELIYGRVKSLNDLDSRHSLTMTVAEDWDNGNYLYKCPVASTNPGRFGFTVRISPNADDWIRFTPGLITWA